MTTSAASAARTGTDGRAVASEAVERGPFSRLWGLLTAVDGSAPAGWTRPQPGRDGVRRDVAVGVLVAMTIAVSHWSVLGSGILEVSGTIDVDQPPWMRILFPAAMGLAVALRRVAPQFALAWCTAAFLVSLGVGYLEQFLTPYVYFYLLYSAGAWSARRTAVTVLRILITLAMLSSTFVGVVVGSSVGAPDASIEQNAAFGLWASILNVLFYVGALWLGNSEYLRAGQRATMDAQVVELERSRAQLAEQAVRLDRLRIARELHDSVAHHVSLMGVQAAVARRTLEVSTDSRDVPESVTTAMERVEVSAREAVEELQSVLVTLRSEDEGTAPEALSLPTVDSPSTRTLAQIPALVDSVTESGMTVSFQQYGESPESVISTVELTVYRVLQEALTNVRKHAGPVASADVRLRFDEDWIELDVTDDGVGPADRVPDDLGNGGSVLAGGGRGIVGMRERAHAVGGTLTVGARDPRGFRVLLRVPTRGGERIEDGTMARG
ncbi:sensor histidine kinase [Brevibacterium yomogidense]|uniref:histidine kinase n=1 Tax=Brevibacterium yomogidense TaxID=946573 RepID=A0A1X6WX59_9MICO|nr:histidine kinase [Brevibacterium yomogidense]SLM89283.1 two-component system sensor kinase [Brevibacterium yomogidense]